MVHLVPSLPLEMVTRIFPHLPDIDILCLGRVCRVWRAISEDFSRRLFQKKEVPLHTCQLFPTYRALYSYFVVAMGLHRKKAWKSAQIDHVPASPLFFAPQIPYRGQVEFQELGEGEYLVRAGLTSRRVLLPLVTEPDLSTLGFRSHLVENDFPPELGQLFSTVPGDKPDIFYALSTSGSVYEVRASNGCLRTFLILTLEGASFLECSPEGLLIIGTETGLLIIYNPLTKSRNEINLGPGRVDWLKVCRRKSETAIIARHASSSVIFISDLLKTPQIKRMPLHLTALPFIHADHLICKGQERFVVMDLSTWQAKPFGSEWAYANQVGNNQMLVQKKNGNLFLYDEKMGRTCLGWLRHVTTAAFFQDDYLVVAEQQSVVLMRKEKGRLRKIHTDSPHLDENEIIFQVHFSEDGFLTYSTDRGKFFFTVPRFQGLRLPRIPFLLGDLGDKWHPTRFPYTAPVFAWAERGVIREKVSVPIEVALVLLKRQTDLDVLRCGRVARNWRTASEMISKERYEALGCLMGRGRPREPATYRSIFSFQTSICRKRKRAWLQNTTPSMMRIRDFIGPAGGILRDRVAFEEVVSESYLVRCGCRARLVRLPFIAAFKDDSVFSSRVAELDFTDQFGDIRHVVRVSDYFYVMSGYYEPCRISKACIQGDELVYSPAVTAEQGESLGYDQGLLVVGTRDGKLTGWKESKSELSQCFSFSIGKGGISWLKVYTIKSQRFIIALQEGELVVITHLSRKPQIQRLSSLRVSGKPFVHGSSLICKTNGGYQAVDLFNPEKRQLYQWIYANPVADHQLLVQDAELKFLLFDEEMNVTLLGDTSWCTSAAYYQDDYLIAADNNINMPRILIYQRRADQLNLVHESKIRYQTQEKFIQVHVSKAGSFTWCTNRGSFMYWCPNFNEPPVPQQRLFVSPLEDWMNGNLTLLPTVMKA